MLEELRVSYFAWAVHGHPLSGVREAVLRAIDQLSAADPA